MSPCTSEIVCCNLVGLSELYIRVDCFLNMESTREAFSHCKEELWVSQVLDGSVQILDVCSSLRDAMVEVKEHVQNLRFSLRRRRKGDSSIEKSICRYGCLRKKMKKNSRSMIKSLNQMVHRLEALAMQQCAKSCSNIVQILIQVNIATILVYKSILSFLSTPVLKKKMIKWSLMTKMRKKKVAVAAAWEDANVNEFASVDDVLLRYSFHKSVGSCNKVASVISMDKLVMLESIAKSIEIHMERIFRNLVTTRVSLLNTFSQ